MSTLKTRIQLRHDTEANWTNVATTFIPLVGECCLTIDGENKGRVKYGDGSTTWGNLPYSGGSDIVEIDSSIVKLLNQGEELDVISDEGDWLRVSSDGTEGYVSKDYVQVNEETVNTTPETPTEMNVLVSCIILQLASPFNK